MTSQAWMGQLGPRYSDHDEGFEQQELEHLAYGSSDDDYNSETQDKTVRDGDDDQFSDDDLRDDDAIVENWKRQSYSQSTLGEIARNFNTLKAWQAEHPEFSLLKPFSRSLCIRYMLHQSTRRIPWKKSDGTASTRRVEDGTLQSHYRMLMHYGFDESDERLKCPLSLRIALKNAIRSHARSLPAMKNQGMHPHDVLSEPISWDKAIAINKYLHQVEESDNVDFRLNMYTLQLQQGLYRQELCGKTSFHCLNLNSFGDMVVVNISGGKADQAGQYSYGKRFGCNADEPHNCFVTSLARHIFSRTSEDDSTFLYMTNDQAQRYNAQIEALDAANRAKEEPNRTRRNGPHTKFRAHFTKVISRMDSAHPGFFGVHKKTITLHSYKRVGYRQVRRCPSIRSEHLGARADHRSGNAHTYGTKSSKGDPLSGGPEERADTSMAKMLANRIFNTEGFNAIPPHFKKCFADLIPFDRICPCYASLPENVRRLLPLLLAQLVHHYHSVEGVSSLGSDNPLHRSPLWSIPEWIDYRFLLFEHLLGANYEGEPDLKSELRDIETDKFLIGVQCLQNQSIIMQCFPQNSAVISSWQATNKLVKYVTNSSVEVPVLGSPFALGHLDFIPDSESSIGRPTQGVHAPASESTHPRVSVTRSVRHQARGTQLSSIQTQGVRVPASASTHAVTTAVGVVLHQVPAAFQVPSVISVRLAWARYHALGTDRQGLWRNKTACDIDISLDAKRRKAMRELFNKVAAVCRMLQGTNSNAEVDSAVSVDRAFEMCKSKVTEIWGCDILQDGSAAVRTVYNIMLGEGIKSYRCLTRDSCLRLRAQCLAAKWKDTIVTQKVMLDFAIRTSDTTLSPDFGSHDIDQADGSAVASGESSADPSHCGAETKDDAIAYDIDDAHAVSGTQQLVAECFVCALCGRNRIFSTWRQYLRHWKVHKAEQMSRKTSIVWYPPEKDEVQCVLGVKDNSNPLLKYRAQGEPYLKRYSPQSTCTFLRRRLVYRRILQNGDRLTIKCCSCDNSDCDGICTLSTERDAIVMDSRLVMIRKAYHVSSVRYTIIGNINILDPNETCQRVPVTSIMRHYPKASKTQSSPVQNSNMPAALISRVHIPSSSQMSKTTVPTRSQPNQSLALTGKSPFHLQSVASDGRFLQKRACPASNNVPSPSPSGISSNVLPVSASRRTSLRSSQLTGPVTCPSRIRPSILNRRFSSRQLFEASSNDASEASKAALHQWSDSALKLSSGEHVMLRDVSDWGTCLRISNAHASFETGKLEQTIGTYAKPAIMFPTFQVEETVFVEEDFGPKFGRIYPSHIQNTLNAFELDETNRSFFMCLGIATGHDPFKLQCLFRSHAAYLRDSASFRHFVDSLCNDDDESEESFYDHNLEIFADCLKVNGQVSFLILQHCWPQEFCNLQIIIFATKGTELDVYEFSEKPNTFNSKTIYMRVHDGHFTVLTPIHNINWFVTTRKKVESHLLIHMMRPEFKCPSISSLIFKEVEHDSLYVSCALLGTVPSADDLDNLWLNATKHCGLEFDSVSRTWTEIPENVSTSDSFQMGSMHPSSWERVTNSLLTELNASRLGVRNLRRSTRLSCTVPNEQADVVSCIPSVFLDAGSEAGTGLFRMLRNSSINHVAGIEIQEAWFKISVKIFRYVRSLCEIKQFRMPAVTIVRSCMLADHACVKYLLSIASIVWINNFVFDNPKPYFSAKREHKGTTRDVTRAPLHTLLAANDPRRVSLAANAAFVFARQFHGKTCIALYFPDHFNSVYGYQASDHKVEVKPTWGQQHCIVHILNHYREIAISCNWRFQCATHHDIAAFHDFMRKYSESIPFAFHKMRETSLYSRQSQYTAVSRRSGRRMRQFSGADNINAIDCEVVEGDAPDTADIEKILGVRSLPHPFNQDNMSIQLLTCFQTGQILDSVVIDEYVSLLATHFSDVHFPRIYNFDNKKYHSWTTKEREQYFNSHFKCRLSKSVFAINTGFHWVAVKVDTVQHYIATVCSMQNSLPNELHSILEMFSIGHDTNAFQHFPVTVPHQRNAVDCGPLCCMFLLFLSQDDVSSRSELSYETHFTANQMRMRMFADIRQGHITPLLQKH